MKSSARRRKPSPSVRYHEGEVIRRVIELCGDQTLLELQGLVGLHAETIRRYLRGISSPSVDFIARLCLATGASAEWVLFGVGGKDATDRGPSRQPRLKKTR